MQICGEGVGADVVGHAFDQNTEPAQMDRLAILQRDSLVFPCANTVI
jgi:hypothetical protein